VPEHDFAVVSLANAGPDGLAFNQAVLRWALETYLGLNTHAAPPPGDDSRSQEIVARYDDEVMAGAHSGRRWLAALMRPDIVGIDLSGRLLSRLAQDTTGRCPGSTAS